MLARTQLHANRFLGLRLGFGHLLHLALLVVPATTQKCTGRVFPGTTSDPRAFARSYDYVIVGGGTAGLALASRQVILTDDPNVHVGVIEAGIFHQDDPLIDEPVNAGLVNGNPDYDWNFVSVPQPNANGRAVEMPRYVICL
ncbi:hypothetical protein OF83DRAFT_1178911 [Amylostereum chailletii]|nr:hypothetical protein OF83DRAFT_1178911 [Amylostereum chailletii]